MERNELEIKAVIGFSGKVIDGLILHPDNEHLIYPIGCQIIVRNVITKEQRFLKGHDNDVSVIEVSPSGKYLASGQLTHTGFKADICIWEFETGALIHRLSIHKVAIQTLSFSYNDKYLASVGGSQDNYLIVWDIESGKPLCGATAGTDFVHQVKFLNNCDATLLTCQDYGIRKWHLDYELKKVAL